MAIKSCMTCKYFAQGKSCSFCACPDQPDSYLKKYAYHNFFCPLFFEGIHKSRVDYMNMLIKEEQTTIDRLQGL